MGEEIKKYGNENESNKTFYLTFILQYQRIWISAIWSMFVAYLMYIWDKYKTFLKLKDFNIPLKVFTLVICCRVKRIILLLFNCALSNYLRKPMLQDIESGKNLYFHNFFETFSTCLNLVNITKRQTKFNIRLWFLKKSYRKVSKKCSS